MAAEVASMPVNGNYAPHSGYGSIEQQANNYSYGSNNSTSQSIPAQPPSSSTPAATSTSTNSEAAVSKDEVGWYFVEQYYTTLSRSPEKLYLFYNKRPQFVSGQETDKVTVCVGQRAINDKIKELDFHECKVRVTNVDSQASDSNIVIQVIGEISNKSQPHQKFTQTFVLATQTNGYFVLNDIFRYLIEEEDEPDAEPVAEDVQPATEADHQEPAPTATEVEPKTLTSALDPAAVEHDAKQVDQELEEKVLKEQPEAEQTTPPAPAPASEQAPAVNGVAAAESEVEHADEEPVAAAQAEDATPADVSNVETKEADLEPEKPQDPVPTPSVSPPKQASPQPPPAASKPAAPKTWASLAASANRVATPATPSSTSSNASAVPRPTPPSSKASAPASGATTAPPSQPPSGPAAMSDEAPSAAATGEGDEWTAVSSNHNRQQSRQTNVQEQQGPQTRGYIKNVMEGVDSSELKAQLEQYGELVYFDVARQKNCAFVDFKTAEGYTAAVGANPHTVAGERLYVEERRIRPAGAPYIPQGQFRGGRGRGSPGQGPPRGSFGGRGNYVPRGGRGGQAAPRGRGSSQAT